jgi:FkbM family methyltransferase
MPEFLSLLYNKVRSSLKNNYKDNYDEERFGRLIPNRNLKSLIKQKINNGFVSKDLLENYLESLKEISINKDRFQFLYDSLADDASKELLIDIWAYRVLGNKHIKLRTNSSFYWDTLSRLKALADNKDVIDPSFMHFKLPRHNLKQLGKNVELYFMSLGVLIDFFLEQYKYAGEGLQIEANDDDVVIDAGGCWGDTAIYFASKINEKGKVYTFEFIPGNVEIFKKNLEINPQLSSKIEIVENPVWNESGHKVYFSNNGPGSKVSTNDFDGSFGRVETISIDDFMECKKIDRLNFLKMDIEGAEPFALEGAKNQ